MKRYGKQMICFVVLLCLMGIKVKAEERTTAEDTTCSYASKAYLNKVAGSVEATTDFKYAEDGSVTFAINIYNITEDIYVVVSTKGTEGKVGEEYTILPTMTENNKYTFDVADIQNIITYSVTVRTNKFGCIHDIRKFTFVKPKRNKFHDMEECKYNEVLDYYYCQEWVTSDFALSEQDIIEKINRERQKKRQEKITKCINCKEEEKEENRFQKIKKYIIIGLSIGIVMDLIVIVVMIRNIRRAEEW